jgi:uncharacterized protein
MRIELDKLDESQSRFAYSYEPEELQLDDEHLRLTEPPQITARIKRSGQQVRLRGMITARAEVDCDRCLKAVAVPIETNFDVTYVPASAYAPSQQAVELEDEDMSLSVYENATIDVDELMREQVLLACPTRALCSEECHGLCPVCGTDKNVNPCECEPAERDSRWDSLKDLRF